MPLATGKTKRQAWLMIFLFAGLTERLPAQLTPDSIKTYLAGTWERCTCGNSSYYFDSPSVTDSIIAENDDVTPADSVLTFYIDYTFTTNNLPDKRPFALSRLLNSVESPYKIALGKTEYVFEIREGGFFLNRLILGNFDENENWYYHYKRPGKCKSGK